MTTKHVPIASISIDGGTQARAEIHAATVDEYAEALTEGESLPPAVVFFDGAQHHLADGFHRLHANRKIGAITIECDVRTGTLLDARMFAYGANRNHGLRRTAADKRKAVAGMLADFPDMSDRAIAKHVGVSHPFVAAIRCPEVQQRQADARRASAAKGSDTAATPEPGKKGQVESDSTQEAEGDTGNSSGNVESDSTPGSTPPTDPRDAQIKELAGQLDEIKQMAGDLLADNKAMSEVFDADDKLKVALAEAKKLRAEVSGLRERVTGLLGEKNEAIRLMKSWRKRAENAEKAASGVAP